MRNIEDVIYRRHNIKVIARAVGFQARAFRGLLPIGDIITQSTYEGAVSAVRDFLDREAADLLRERGESGVPCATEFGRALAQVRMNKPQEAMLMAHLRAPMHTLTATELAQAAGYEDYVVANSMYGKLGFALAHELDWVPSGTSSEQVTWTFALADDADNHVP